MEGTNIPMAQAITQAYVAHKPLAKALAAVHTQAQIDECVAYMKKHYPEVRIVVVSSGSTTKSTTAKQMIEADEADMILTVYKASEGFDCPKLSSNLELVPKQSPARIIQNAGRVVRTHHTKTSRESVRHIGAICHHGSYTYPHLLQTYAREGELDIYTRASKESCAANMHDDWWNAVDKSDAMNNTPSLPSHQKTSLSITQVFRAYSSQ
jgi:superfamily II DNA or RNA helicase